MRRVHSDIVDEIRVRFRPRDQIALDCSGYLQHHSMTGCDLGCEVSQHRWWLAPNPRHVLDVSGTSDCNDSRNVTLRGFSDQLHAGFPTDHTNSKGSYGPNPLLSRDVVVSVDPSLRRGQNLGPEDVRAMSTLFPKVETRPCNW